jgi:hypothetical protein
VRGFLYLLGAVMFLGVLAGLVTRIQPVVVYSGEDGAAEEMVFPWILIAGLFVGGWGVWFLAGIGDEDDDEDEPAGSE